MNFKKYISSPKILSVMPLLSLFLSSILINQLPSQAENSQKKITSNYDITFEPPNDNQPKTTIGGASRGGECIASSKNTSPSFAPLVPTGNNGLTTASHPTLLIHIPATSAGSVFFRLQDDEEEDIYQAILPISSQSGVISVSLPPETPGLETGKNYKWSSALMCDNKLRPDSPTIEGYITKIEPKLQLATKLENASPIETAALYGKAGIWYETVATLAELRQTQPQDRELQNAWNDILNSVGLENVAKAELID